MLGFIRSDITQFTAYTPHPSGDSGQPVTSAIAIDRLDTNESPFDLPVELKEKLAWTYQQNIEANRYPDGSHQSLKDAIAQYVNESATLEKLITPAHISVGNGSDELIRSVLISSCLQGEGSILVANPTFSMYGILAQTLGIPVITVGRSPENFEINLTEARDAIAQTQHPPVRVVFVVHPNSPTANPLTAAELEWIRSLPEHILVVIDEAYFEFSQTSVVGELQQRPNWAVLRTFSKAFRLAAYRLGYCIAHPELIAALEKIRLPYNLPSLSQSAALIALTHRQTLLASIPQTIAERDKLWVALSELATLQVWSSAANFIYLRPRISVDLAEFVRQMKAHGTLVRHTGGGLRITVGSIEENTRTLQRLKAVLANYEK
ncbi:MULTISPECIES: histidinol-phosphate transaminase [unclassified Coleofasciculus]|uniref:histidinol-phosphate transaminase n=1 Tax=unclassified Coleofasciculus TaxID=2692782 RepID=UPI00187E41DA|nr:MULTISPECIES: histidinol-phosphate transaminase [unclassified Coleofasciculus]MBE9124836.1 histidinol-phosphate transaminase [Coleofasciculus sp. LEGE 07081]MBE9147741.1 histidinol-phosphate transaminase [Coleofasciculus sp. LEGE 07092]